MAIPAEIAEIEAVVDTNILSYEMSDSPQHEEIASRYLAELRTRVAGITFQSQVEILVGLETQGWDRTRLDRVLSGYKLIEWLPEMNEFYVAIQVEAARRGRG